VKILHLIRQALAISFLGSEGACTGAAASGLRNGPPQPKGLGLPLCLDCGHALTAFASTFVVVDPAQDSGLLLESSPLHSYLTTRGCMTKTAGLFLKKHQGLVLCQTGVAREIDLLFAVEVVGY
jgi:hypothetical protein